MIATLAEYNKTLFLPERGETHIQAGGMLRRTSLGDSWHMV